MFLLAWAFLPVRIGSVGTLCWYSWYSKSCCLCGTRALLVAVCRPLTWFLRPLVSPAIGRQTCRYSHFVLKLFPLRPQELQPQRCLAGRAATGSGRSGFRGGMADTESRRAGCDDVARNACVGCLILRRVVLARCVSQVCSQRVQVPVENGFWGLKGCK